MGSMLVITGTSVDSKKGVDALHEHGVDAIGYGLSTTPYEQAGLYRHPSQLEARIHQVLNSAPRQPALIYCNSLSWAVDWSPFRQLGYEIWDLVPIWQGIILSVASSEKTLGFVVADPLTRLKILALCRQCKLSKPPIGEADLDLVHLFEISRSEGKMRLLHKLHEIIDQGADIIVIGCTHWDDPSLSRELPVPVIQPGLILLNQLIRYYQSREQPAAHPLHLAC
jgi:hypothetical protein